MAWLWRCRSNSATCSVETMAAEAIVGVEMDRFMDEEGEPRISEPLERFLWLEVGILMGAVVMSMGLAAKATLGEERMVDDELCGWVTGIVVWGVCVKTIEVC